MTWMNLLKQACAAQSQKAVGQRIGYSASTINMVLKGKYTGDLGAVERAVNLKLSCQTIPCPILGDITASACSEHQNKPFVSSGSMRSRLYKACRTCPYNTKRKEKS